MAVAVSALVLLILGFQAVTRGENKLPHEYYTLVPKIFTDSEPPIKWLIGGRMRGAPYPPDPPLWGGQSIFFGGMPDLPLSQIFLGSY